MIRKICVQTGLEFTISDQEMNLRKKLNVAGEPETSPTFRLMQLGAFWQSWNLHHRKCDKTGRDIISVFRPDCPYPVWHKDEWIKNANPPSIEFNQNQPVFDQMWGVFQKSPIAHNVGAGNENCEYTDDWWYSKNCYLCHSGFKCEDARYCYRTLRSKDCQYCVLSEDNELCVDLINSHKCFSTIYSYNCHLCHNSAFLYDCRNCDNCMFCWNLRNKKYCFQNEQLTEAEYRAKAAELDFKSRMKYDKAKESFQKILENQAWLKASTIEKCENSTGDYLDQCKDCEECYFLTSGAENCIHTVRAGANIKDCLDAIGPAFQTELIYLTCMAQDKCFGCCGLVGKNYCIFNQQYTKTQYEKPLAEVIEYMQKTNEYGQFFPGYFAANPYEESWASFYWPLTFDEQKKYGFRIKLSEEKRSPASLDSSKIPDNINLAKPEIMNQIFWDDQYGRPFQIQKADIDFSSKLGIPLPNCFYMHRIQDNFRWIPFNGSMRNARCAKCKKEVRTSWSEKYDRGILCEACYQKEIY
ncbi:MAG: hypothetical protein NTZ80_04315 [Patescibacteria group bacterium]|nr:hypothetical protein [Patescibacteria group bacterium]